MELDLADKDHKQAEEWENRLEQDVVAWVVRLPRVRVVNVFAPVVGTRCRMSWDSRAIRCNVPSATRL